MKWTGEDATTAPTGHNQPWSEDKAALYPKRTKRGSSAPFVLGPEHYLQPERGALRCIGISFGPRPGYSLRGQSVSPLRHDTHHQL